MGQPATASGGASPVYRVGRVLVYFVYAFAVASIVLLATAFFLRLFNASESPPFVQWVYRSTRIIMQPFRGIFPTIEGESGSVFDASLLFAMFIYGLLAMGMHALIDWIDRRMAMARAAQMWSSQGTGTSAAIPPPASARGSVTPIPEVTTTAQSPPPGSPM